MLATMKERLAYFSKERDFFIPNFVRKIKEQFPEFPVIATGGPTRESIKETILAGANAITYTPPTTAEVMSELMDKYREF